MTYVYVLKSKKDGHWYTGSTRDLRKRLNEHNVGRVFSTKQRGPFDLIYYEACVNEQDARAREKYLKSGPGKRYLRNRLRRFLSVTGFTLIELLISTAIFTIVIIVFIAIFVEVMGVQANQTSIAAVNGESQFLLQKIQYYVELSSVVSTTQDLATSTLTLRMPSSSIDPTVISLAGGTVYLEQAGGALQPLTSNRVAISNLSFTRRANTPGHDSVNVAFTVSYNTSNVKQMFTQALQTSVARVSAATFDSGVYPSTSMGALGSVSQTWNPINGIIYFSGTNVGVNAVSPQQALEVNGGLRLNTSGSLPTCNATSRGTLWFWERATTANDSLQVCYENASGTYQWYQIL